MKSDKGRSLQSWIMSLRKQNQRKKASMNKFTHLDEFLGILIDNKDAQGKAKEITKGILKARSPRLSDISREMPAKSEANYKSIQRFLNENDLRGDLLHLFQEKAEFVIGDPTEMPRPQAKKTNYVG